MNAPLSLQSLQDRVSHLKEVIAVMQAAGKRTDFLEEKLRELQPPKSREVDLFKECQPINTFLYINEIEVNQMQAFGYVVFDNPQADINKLRSSQAYKAKGANFGF